MPDRPLDLVAVADERPAELCSDNHNTCEAP